MLLFLLIFINFLVVYEISMEESVWTHINIQFVTSKKTLYPLFSSISELSVQMAGLYETFLVGAGSWTRGLRDDGWWTTSNIPYLFGCGVPNYSSIIVQLTYFIPTGFWNYLTWHWHENIYCCLLSSFKPNNSLALNYH
jgi:hypothetical protein